ncbi:MAG: hypothetical protein JRF15_13010 [Deltaproteobacteria bacterium]|nr:hypothetical protein [Deltaproteobacteria bacterium]
MSQNRSASFDVVDVRICLALIALSLLWYLRTAGYGFVDFDDTRVLLGHPNLYDENSFLSSVREIFSGYYPREEPLLVRDLSWAVDARLFGFDNPFGYHLGNIALNALNVGLLFLFLRRTTRSTETSAAVAACFALLPVHVEPVCWVMGRKDMLAAFFLLGALLAQSFELDDRPKAQRRALYLLALVFTLLALFSKASALVFFLVLGLHRLFHPYLEAGRSPRAKIAWGTRGGRAALAVAPHAAISVLFFIWYRGVVGEYGVIGSDAPGPFDPEHLSNMARFGPLIFGQYLAHLAWPVELSMYYRWPHVEIPLTTRELIASAAIALAALAGLGLLIARRRDLAFHALVALTLLLPYTGLFYVGFWSADRYIYLASAGALVIAAVSMRELSARNRFAAAASALIAVAFVSGSAIQSWRQQAVWRDGESLWLYEAYRSEPSLLSIQALAKTYLKRAEREPAGPEHETWITRAETEIERGFARHDELGRTPGRYPAPEQLQLARLHYLRGRIAELRREPIENQLHHFARAFELAPERLTAIYTSRSLFAMAGYADGPRQQKLIEDSFDYFVHYIEFSLHDSLQLAESERMLEINYEGRFPFLEERILETRETYFQ